MAQILHIDASPRGARSHSRALSHEFVDAWKASHPGDTVTYRDLGRSPVPHVDEAWVIGAFAPPEDHTPEAKAALAVSDALVDEFLAADRYVFGVPMYNLNIPSTFKAYIDQIVRANRTFSVGANGLEGLVKGKKAVFLTARGSDLSPDSPLAPYDYQENYLRAIFGFIGITDIEFINANALNWNPEARDKNLAAAKEQIQALVQRW